MNVGIKEAFPKVVIFYLSIENGVGTSQGEANDDPLQYSCLENPVDRGAWRAAVHRLAQSSTQ